jgi:hypothetical protein
LAAGAQSSSSVKRSAGDDEPRRDLDDGSNKWILYQSTLGGIGASL